MQEILYIVLLSLGSIIILFLLAKLMGYRQLSQLSMFDYINGITIGSIAAEMATSLDDNFLQPLTAMIVYGLVSVLLSYCTSKSIKTRRFLYGKPLILLKGNNIYYNNLKKAKLDLSEFLEQCRVSGYFDISQLDIALYEANGKISFLPKSTYRPVSPSDLSLHPETEHLVANLIFDGEVLKENLHNIGHDEDWLNRQILGFGVNSVSEILLATYGCNNILTIYLKSSDGKDNVDILT